MSALGRKICHILPTLALVLLLAMPWALWAQVSPPSTPIRPLELYGRLPGGSLDLGSYTLFYEDASGDTLPLSVIRTKYFRPFQEKRNERANPSSRSVMVTWLQFTLRNTHPNDTLRVLFHPGPGHGRMTTYREQKPAVARLIDETGFDYLPRRGQSDDFATLLVLPPRAEHTYWVRVMDYILVLTPIVSQLVTPEQSWKAGLLQLRFFVPLLILMCGLAGCMLFMGSYAFYYYRLTRDRAFLYYGLYAACGLFYLIQCIDYQFALGLLLPFYPTAMINPFNVNIAFVFYSLFLNELLGLRVHYPRNWRVVELLMGLLVLQQGISLVDAFRQWPMFEEAAFYRYGPLVSGVLLLVLLWTILRSRLPIRPYLLAGNGLLIGLFILPSLIFPYVDQLPAVLNYMVNYPLLWIMTGLTGELFCFAMALAYRGRLIELENGQMQQRHAQDLADKLAQRTREVEQQSKQLIQKEKMASLGELTAGIAHEIQNPLNFVNNFSEVSVELTQELGEVIDQFQVPEAEKQAAVDLLADLNQNLSKIHHHGQRADSIVKGMLQHSRVSTGEKQSTDLNALAEEYLQLAYQGLRVKDQAFNAELIVDVDQAVGQVAVVPQEIGRVLLNLCNNAFYATRQKKHLLNGQYQPTVKVSTRKVGDKVEIRVSDNGTGIPENAQGKIFQPFFTTKPTGEGTGLGLSLSYDIITKGHGGELKVETRAGEFAEFTLVLPANPTARK